MALSSPLTVQPYDFIGDPTGRPLNKGRIYIGEANKDPEFYPIPVYFDQALTREATQPIRTNNGFVDFAGSLAELYASEDIYSVKVLDEQGRKIVYKGAMMRNNLTDDALSSLNSAIAESQQSAENALNSAVLDITSEAAQTVQNAVDSIIIDGAVTDSFVAVTAQYDTAITRQLHDINGDAISVKDFGAKGDGLTNDKAYIQNAINKASEYGFSLHFPKGSYLLSGIDLKGVSLTGDNATILSDGNNLNRVLIRDTSTKIVKISGITFDGTNHVADANNTGVKQQNMSFENNKYVLLNNVNHVNCPDLVANFGFGVSSVRLDGGFISNCAGANTFFFRSKHNSVSGLTFKDCSHHVLRFGRLSSESSNPAGVHNTIVGCTFQNIGNDAILFELDSGHSTVTGCVGERIRCLVKCETGSSLPVLTRARRIIVSNNICRLTMGELSAAVKLYAAEDSIVTGNIIDGFNEGISVGKNSVVANNVITNITSTAIRGLGDFIKVSGNTITAASIGIWSDFHQNELIGNTIKETARPVLLSGTKNTVTLNRINGGNKGIDLTASTSSNIITLNRGTGNTSGISDSGTNNQKQMNFEDFI